MPPPPRARQAAPRRRQTTARSRSCSSASRCAPGRAGAAASPCRSPPRASRLTPHARAQELELEIRSLSSTALRARTGDKGVGALPPNTRVTLTGVPSPDGDGLRFSVYTNTDAVIRCVLAVSEEGGVFEVRARARAPGLRGQLAEAARAG